MESYIDLLTRVQSQPSAFKIISHHPYDLYCIDYLRNIAALGAPKRPPPPPSVTPPPKLTPFNVVVQSPPPVTTSIAQENPFLDVLSYFVRKNYSGENSLAQNDKPVGLSPNQTLGLTPIQMTLATMLLNNATSPFPSGSHAQAPMAAISPNLELIPPSTSDKSLPPRLVQVEPRASPNCKTCKVHGIELPYRSHKCPYSDCMCPPCAKIIARRKTRREKNRLYKVAT